MSTTRSDNSVKFGRFVVIVLAVLLISQALSFVLVLAGASAYKRQFVVDEQMFISGLNQAVHSLVFPSNNTESVSSSSPSFPSIRYVDGLYTYTDVYGHPWFGRSSSDAVFGLGDFCEDGLIIEISDSRVFCSSTNGVVILRRAATVERDDAHHPSTVAHVEEKRPL